jgi:hypothetical protein
MGRRIVVIGNCQAAGLALALQRIYWADKVEAVASKARGAAARAADTARQLAEADLVFDTESPRADAARKTSAARIVQVPVVAFTAFHPDMAYAGDAEGEQVSYASAIAVWAYNRGLDPAAAARLFTRRTFAELGYFDRWGSSVAHLKDAFHQCGLPFEPFYLAVKRLGTFMHTLNHPKVEVLALLAKTLAIAAGHDPSVWRRDISLPDSLARATIWGVYPEVARELAVPGSYSWLIGRDTLIEGLENYLEHAWESHAVAGVLPGQLKLLGEEDTTLYDAVLTAALARSG